MSRSRNKKNASKEEIKSEEQKNSRQNRFVAEVQPNKMSGGAKILILFFIVATGGLLLFFLRKQQNANSATIITPKTISKKPQAILCDIEVSKVKSENYNRSRNLIMSELQSSLDKNFNGYLSTILDKKYNPSCKEPGIYIWPADNKNGVDYGMTVTFENKKTGSVEKGIIFYATENLFATDREKSSVSRVIHHEIHHAHVTKLVALEPIKKTNVPKNLADIKGHHYLEQYNISEAIESALAHGKNTLLKRVPELLKKEQYKKLSTSEKNELAKYRNAAKNYQAATSPSDLSTEFCDHIKTNAYHNALESNIEIPLVFAGEDEGKMLASISLSNPCIGKIYSPQNEALQSLILDAEIHLNQLPELYSIEAKSKSNPQDAIISELHTRTMEYPQSVIETFFPNLIPINKMLLERHLELREREINQKEEILDPRPHM